MSALEQYCRRIRYFVRSLDSSLNLIWACHTGLSSEDFSFVTYFFVVVASQRDSLETAFSSPENSLQSQVASSMLLCVGHFAGRKWQAHKQHSFHSLRRWRAALASVERQHLLFTVNEIWGDEGNMNIVGTNPDLFFYVSHPHILVCRPCTEVYPRRLGWAKRRALSTLPTFSWCTRHLVDHCYLSSMAPAPWVDSFRCCCCTLRGVSTLAAPAVDVSCVHRGHGHLFERVVLAGCFCLPSR